MSQPHSGSTSEELIALSVWPLVFLSRVTDQRQIDRQTERGQYRLTDSSETDRQTYRSEADIQALRQTDNRQGGSEACRQTDRQTEGGLCL